MSDNEKKNPSKQTSSVPLKKETVRVTLKAADAPPAVPSATLPTTPPPAAPPAVKPPTPTVALKPPSAPVSPPTTPKPPTATIPVPSGAPTAPRAPAPAPTIPLRTAGGSRPPTVGAPTIRLATTNAPIGAPTIALKTAKAPLPGGAPTVALPKATVALNPPTKPLSPTSAAATQRPTLSAQEDGDDESGSDTFTKILAGVGLVAALVVLGLQLKVANIWIGAEDAETPDDWSRLLE